jgi:steroid 5-alpha reductase family enzyme
MASNLLFSDNLYVDSFLTVMIFFHLVYLIALFLKDFSVVDIAWGLGFIVVALKEVGLSFEVLDISHIVEILVFVWGTRLASYILYRKLHHKGEDRRYNDLRKEWGARANIHAYFKIFLFQGLLCFVIAAPIHVSTQTTQLPGLINWIGVGVFLFGLFWETWADLSLAAFLARPANSGQVCRVGPWKYSRHPNYFGEITLWYGLALAAYHDTTSLLAFIGPSILALLMIKVTGIPPINEKRKNDPKYKDYLETTNILIPGPVKRRSL